MGFVCLPQKVAATDGFALVASEPLSPRWKHLGPGTTTLMKEAWLDLVTQCAPQEQRRQAPQTVGRAGTSSTRTVQVSQQLWEAKAENSHRYRNKETTCITWCCSEGTPAPHRQRAGDWCQGHQCWVLLTAHLNNGPGSLPASTCHLWERFSSSIQVSSNQRGPETCVKPKPPKYPAKSQQNPLNPMARTSRKPQCTKSHSGAATANYWSWPWHQWDSFRH